MSSIDGSWQPIFPYPTTRFFLWYWREFNRFNRYKKDWTRSGNLLTSIDTKAKIHYRPNPTPDVWCAVEFVWLYQKKAHTKFIEKQNNNQKCNNNNVKMKKEYAGSSKFGDKESDTKLLSNAPAASVWLRPSRLARSNLAFIDFRWESLGGH